MAKPLIDSSRRDAVLAGQLGDSPRVFLGQPLKVPPNNIVNGGRRRRGAKAFEKSINQALVYDEAV